MVLRGYGENFNINKYHISNMSPIVTHEDEKLLASLDLEIAKEFKKLAKTIKGLSKKEMKLAESYQAYTKDLTNYMRIMKDKLKQVEILVREKSPNVTQGDADEYKKRVQDVSDKIRMIEGYYDRMKDLAVAKDTIVSTMDEYCNLIRDNSSIRRKIVDLGLKIEKAKNKMVAADQISGIEDEIKDTEREFERSQKELEKKWAQLEDERSEVNGLWQGLKGAIDDFE